MNELLLLSMHSFMHSYICSLAHTDYCIFIGKIEKLKDMGIKINKKDRLFIDYIVSYFFTYSLTRFFLFSTLKDELDDKLGDDDVRNAVLGTLTTEEEEVIRLMELQQNQLNAIEGTYSHTHLLTHSLTHSLAYSIKCNRNE